MIRILLRWLWMLAGWIELLALTALLYPLAFLPPRFGGRPWYRRLFRLWCLAWVDALGVDLRLHQKNRSPLPGQYILVANHPSAFEDIGIPALFPVNSLAKMEVRRWPVTGRIAAAAGTFFVQRESRTSRKQAMETLLRALEQGYSLAIYPEGGIKGKRLHLPFRHGVFELSLRSGVPILPVFLHYEAQEDFHWSRELLPVKLFQIMRSRNNRAHYYQHDLYHPEAFDDKETYCRRVQDDFLRWQEKYLD